MKASGVDIPAWRRVPFGGGTGDRDFIILGANWSDAVCAMQVRGASGETGEPFITLGNAPAGQQGIYAWFEPAYPHPVTGQTVGATIFRPQIDAVSFASIPMAGDDPAEILELWFDLHVTLPGLPTFLLLFGRFLLYPGVTI